MYYYQNMKTKLVAKEMNVSRSTVSRMLSFAKTEGLVNIQSVDPIKEPQRMEKRILERFKLERARVVTGQEIDGRSEWLQ
jgi:deoxyribonucleoside regulator